MRSFCRALLGEPALAGVRMPGSSLKGQNLCKIKLDVVCASTQTRSWKYTLL